uniref:WW domain-containing protein n=1 Tax=Odontella aurita TaxID=265563 RepID=A0A7S4JEA5_9STRA|mmetsp:Transcript_44804/g.136787  ORF Transcript_44804/g.136787 Transcript_44804/m.136787 type:complete len:313 (+) Transcript_44804:46-984(+)
MGSGGRRSRVAWPWTRRARAERKQKSAKAAAEPATDDTLPPPPPEATNPEKGTESTASSAPVTFSPSRKKKKSRWRSAVDPSTGQTYYYNRKTRETMSTDPDATADRDDSRAVDKPGDKGAVAVQDGQTPVPDDDDDDDGKLAWLLEEARMDIQRAASSAMDGMAQTASSVSLMLIGPPKSLTAGDGSGGGGGSSSSAGKGAASSRAAGDGTDDDEGKMSWLLAEAKADVARVSSTLSQSIASARTSSRATNGTEQSRTVQVSESDDRGGGDGDDDGKMAWLLEEARADFAHTASRLSLGVAPEAPSSREGA